MQFAIQLKNGTTAQALAVVVCYNKAFHGGRFVYSSGKKVKREGFNAAKPGKELKRIWKTVEDAYDSIIAEGSPLNSDSLKARVQLLLDQIQWVDNELRIYNGSTIEKHIIDHNVSRSQLEKLLRIELTKAHPNTKKVINSVLSEGANELFGFWQKIIDGKIESKDGKPFSKNTIKAKKQTLDILKRYQEYAKVSLSFDSMDMVFYQDFMLWMKTIGKDGKPYDLNSRGKNIKDIKAVLNLARTNQYISHNKFDDWAIPKEPNEVVLLDKQEFLKVVDLELTGTHEDIRDIFVIASFSGARISDFKSFTPENVFVDNDGIKKIRYTQEKTGAPCKIPLHPLCLAILDKRNGQFPKMISEQNFRSGLKVVVEKAIKDKDDNKDRLKNTIVVKIRGNKEVRALKYHAISPHSARRFFCSSLYYGWFKEDAGWFNKPMPAAFIMRFSGHKTETSFVRYIGSSEKELEERTMEFFNAEPQMKAS